MAVSARGLVAARYGVPRSLMIPSRERAGPGKADTAPKDRQAPLRRCRPQQTAASERAPGLRGGKDLAPLACLKLRPSRTPPPRHTRPAPPAPRPPHPAPTRPAPPGPRHPDPHPPGHALCGPVAHPTTAQPNPRNLRLSSWQQRPRRARGELIVRIRACHRRSARAGMIRMKPRTHARSDQAGHRMKPRIDLPKPGCNPRTHTTGTV